MSKKMVKQKPPSINKLLLMLVEWCDATDTFDGNYNDWWKKYPQYSLKNIIELAKRRLKSRSRKQLNP